MLINNNAPINSNLGNITLQNTGTATGPLVQFNSGAVLHASGAASKTNEGNIYCVVAATIPTMFVQGLPPSADYLISFKVPGSAANFGSSPGNTSGSILTSGISDKFVATGRTINFNTAVTSQISLGTNVVITADPPAGVAPNQNPTAVNFALLNPATAPLLAPSLTNYSASISAVGNNTMTAGSESNNALASSLNFALANNIVGLAAAALATEPGQTQSTSFPQVGALSAIETRQNLPADPAISTKHRLNGAVSNIKHQMLKDGVLLLAPDQATVVDTDLGSVAINAGAVTLLVASDKSLAVYNLHDGHKEAVTIVAGGRCTLLTPGLSAIFTRSPKQSFEELNPAAFVTYRGCNATTTGDGITIHQAEFQIVSLLRGLPQVSGMIGSNIAAKEKAMARVLKTAAILVNIGTNNVPFTYKVAPEMAACAISGQ